MAETGGSRPLAGVRVLVTRPAHQAEPLAQLIEAAGGEAIRFPTLEIAAPRDPAALERRLAALDDFDLAIFISPNAVTQALPRLHGRLPARLVVAAIGRGTAQALTQAGVTAVIAPAEGSDSEALLALPPLQRVAGKHIVIFRGEGGRELLGDTLVARGAEVEFAECYRRVRPATDAAPLGARLLAGGIDIVTVTSVESLRNLHAMLDTAARERLRRTPIVVVGPRQAAAARTLGMLTEPRVAQAASDAAILDAIKAWRVSQKPL